MKQFAAAIGAAALLMSSMAHSAEPVSINTAKAGIAAGPQVYRIYQVACSNDATTAIASLGAARWCYTENNALNCERNRSDAAMQACAATADAYASINSGGELQE